MSREGSPPVALEVPNGPVVAVAASTTCEGGVSFFSRVKHSPPPDCSKLFTGMMAWFWLFWFAVG